MKKLLFIILMLGSLFADIGVGFHIQSVPKISIPIKFKKIIIEPSIQYYMTKQKPPSGYWSDYYLWANEDINHSQRKDQITTIENIFSIGFYKKNKYYR